MPVTVTETAARRIDQIIAEHGFDPANMKLRVGVKGGGCSGFNYTLDLTEVQKDSDEVWNFTYNRTPKVSTAALAEGGEGGGTATATETGSSDTFTVTIVCDPKSYLYLNGTTIDYKDEIMGSGFVFNNPNSTSTCGCGSSFSA
ncbi:MAG: HesB/IscA family protein [bacterium]|jgi:iron-sulfur cluster assembly protein